MSGRRCRSLLARLLPVVVTAGAVLAPLPAARAAAPVFGSLAAGASAPHRPGTAAWVAPLRLQLVDVDAPPPALGDLLVGALQWPLRGRLTSGFGVRRHPVTGQVRQHAGIDVAAPVGTPIGAAAPGRVLASGPRGGYGLAVDIDHGGLVTRYAHASALVARLGDVVAAGQVVALVGATGTATGPHLHFEVRLGGVAQDPLRWLP